MISNEMTIHFYKVPPKDVECCQIERTVPRDVYLIIASSVRRRQIDENSTQEEECDTNWHILWPVKRRSNFRIHRKSIHITLKFFVILNRIVFIFFLLRMKYSKLLRIKRIYMLRK